MTGRRFGFLALVLVLAALALTVAACGGDDKRAVETTESTTAVWEKVVPGGDCECADGSEFAFWERRNDPTKVVFFLDGGGACLDAETCAFTGLGAGGDENYDWKITDDPASEDGIFRRRAGFGFPRPWSRPSRACRRDGAWPALIR